MSTIIKPYPPRIFNVFILSITIAFYSSIFMDIMGLHIPFLRQTFGFIYLTFIPGVILLKILHFDDLTITEIILHSIGLSLSLLMGVGVIINSLNQLAEINRPFSLHYLILFLFLVSSGLCVILWRDQNNFKIRISSAIELKPLPSLSCLLLLSSLCFWGLLYELFSY